MNVKIYKTIQLSILTLLTINTAWANLMISPHRVVFEDRDRSASVSLMNTQGKTTTYRLHWVQQKQTSNGKYSDLPSDSNEVPNASSMLRFSPRQVTLAPGEKQTVRISLRRKKGLTEPEYRSHLLFEALPKQDETTKPGGGSRIKLNLLLGFSIPVIVRQGKLNAQASISNVTLMKTQEKNKGKNYYGARITLQRTGLHSAYGTIKVMWRNRSKNQFEQIGILNNVALYPESNQVTVHVGFKDFKENSGDISISYSGKKEQQGINFDTFKRTITPKDFKLELIE
ncbi:MAG: fimbria/pilus periplasmic chaperone [Gammaproteobacteria bacterium]|nr:fimbria/pilus periplasmic chaperone [Gammaproteobacteria bacterium]